VSKLAKFMSRVHTSATMKKPALHLLFAVLLFAYPALAQQGQDKDNADKEEQTEDEEESTAKEGEGPKRFWHATLPGGEYTVAIDRISSVSMHEYVLNTQLIVTEMAIDTNGRALARFYYVKSVTEGSKNATATSVAERGREVVDRVARKGETDFHNLPQKDYPATSHAGMIEYRLLSLKDLKALYKSVQGALENNQGKTITLK